MTYEYLKVHYLIFILKPAQKTYKKIKKPQKTPKIVELLPTLETTRMGHRGEHFSQNWKQYGDRRALPHQERARVEWRGPIGFSDHRSTQTRNDAHDRRRSYSESHNNNQNNFFTPIHPQNVNNPQNPRPNNQQPQQKQQEQQQQQNQKITKNDQNEKKILDCDVLCGDFPYIITDRDLKKVQKIIKHPNKLHGALGSDLPLKTVEIGDNRRCRNLIIGLNPENYKSGADGSDSKIFKDDNNALKNKTKFLEAMTKLSNDIAVATAFYKPRLVFIEILRRIGGEKSDFEAVLSYICVKHDYIPMIVDPVTRKATYTVPKAEQNDHYTSSLKWYFNNFTAPKIIKINDMDAPNGINVDDL